MVLVTSPNNPTGTAVRSRRLAELLDAVPTQTLVVLDEAYHEYITGRHVPDALELLRRPPEPRRAAHVLEGLRAGRAARRLPARPSRRRRRAVDQTLIPFAVNGARPGRGAGLARTHATSWPSGSTARSPSGTGSQPASAPLGLLGARRRRPTSLAARPARRGGRSPLTLETARRGRPGRSPAKACGSRSARRPRTTGSSSPSRRCAATARRWPRHWGLPTGDRAGDGAALARPHRRRRGPAGRARNDRRITGSPSPIPAATERWDAGQVWAHLAEIGGYWLAELEAVIDAGGEPVPFGRVKTDAGAHRAPSTTGRSARRRPSTSAAPPRPRRLRADLAG